MNENKDISSSSSKSLLSENAIAILNKGMIEGFKDDYLDLRYKKINDNMMPELCEWIIKLGNKVKILSLDGNQITSIGVFMLFDTLKANNSSLKAIYLGDNNQIDDKCMKSLGEYIKSNKSVERIWLDDTSVSDIGIEILVPYLDGNAAFKKLHLNGNKGVTDKSIPLLVKMIESSCIEHIDIKYTSITKNNIIRGLLVCNRIKNGSSELHLSENLEKNKITSKGASVLFDTFKECNSVVSDLYLSNNKLDDECMKQLGEYLQDNEHIDVLRLGFNKITDKGVEILSEYLIGNITLKELGLSYNNGITDASAPHLIEIAKKTCIVKIDLYGTSVSYEKQQELKDTLSIPNEQREIPIKSNTKSAAKASALR